ARGHIQAMEQGRPGETYIIAGPRHTFEQAFALAASMANVRAPFLHPGPTTMRAAAAVAEVAGRFTTLPPSLTPEALRVLAGTTYFGSNERAVRELGFRPRPLEEGLGQTLEHELRQLGRS
ncbi:MAG: epimerase, partial [Acidimicrobiia bacterium]